MCLKVVETNSKGGTGCTTDVVNIGHRLAARDQRTVIFGLDRQVNAEMLLNVEGGKEGVKYLEHVITDPKCVIRPASTKIVVGKKEIELKRENLFYVPGSAEYAGFADTLAGRLNQKESVADRLELLKVVGDRIFSVGDNVDGEKADVVLVDTPKSGPLQQAAIACADWTIIKFRYDYMSLSNTLDAISLANQLMEPEGAIILLPLGGNMQLADGQNGKKLFTVTHNKLQKEVLGELMSHCAQFPERHVILADGIANRQQAPNDSFKGKTVWETKPDSLLAHSYINFCYNIFGV